METETETVLWCIGAEEMALSRLDQHTGMGGTPRQFLTVKLRRRLQPEGAGAVGIVLTLRQVLIQRLAEQAPAVRGVLAVAAQGLLVVALAVAVFYVVAISSGHVTLKRQKLNDIAEATELHMSGRGQMPRFLERLDERASTR